MTKEKNTKHRLIFHRLLEELSSLHYHLDDKLPPERNFAEKLQVNIATIRRAFRELVLAGIVEKKVGSGTYLRQQLSGDADCRMVTLIVSENDSQAFTQQVVSAFTQNLASRHRSGRVVRVSPATLPGVLDSCAMFQQPVIVMTGFGEELVRNLHYTRIVLLSSMAYRYQVPCVLNNDMDAIRMQLKHLQSVGCRKIALLGSSEESALMDYQISIWQQCQGGKQKADLLFRTEAQENISISTFNLIKEKVEQVPFDGLICLSDELMFGALAALRQAGRRVPQDVAVTSMGNTLLAQFANPSVTSIDSDANGHIQTALELLAYNDAHPQQPEFVRYVPMKLVKRESSDRNREVGK